MKSYPSIPTIGTHLIDSKRLLPYDLSKPNWIGFAKTDGSLIRVKWNNSKGFTDFGRKNGLLDDSNPWLLEAPDIVRRDYRFLHTVLSEFGYSRAVIFFEFFGENSFAGSHIEEEHYVSLIDLSVDKKGLVDPRILTSLDVAGGASIVHRGPVNNDLIYKIAAGEYNDVVFEGIVFKRNNRKGIRQMFKSKSNAWYKKLKECCRGDEKLFKKLM
jgi:hypothetical protein